MERGRTQSNSFYRLMNRRYAKGGDARTIRRWTVPMLRSPARRQRVRGCFRHGVVVRIWFFGLTLGLLVPVPLLAPDACPMHGNRTSH